MLVTLAPGVDPRAVFAILDDKKNTIKSSFANASSYLDWAMNTAKVFHNQIQPSDIDRLVLTPRLWRLQELDRVPGGSRFAHDLLSMELTEQIEVFEQTCKALRAEILRWNPAAAYVAVVDTSVFIHHQDKIREIDYAEIVGARSEPVRLVVPRVVIDELDRLKESGNQHTRWRAGHTLGVLDDLLAVPTGRATVHEAKSLADTADVDGAPRGKVTIEVFFDDSRHVRLDDADDEIIDRTLALDAYADVRVSLLTMDTSMALRARMFDLAVHKLSKPLGDEPQPPVPKGR